MPDLYAQITEIPEETVALLADAMETRAQDSEMREMRRRFFGCLELSPGANVLDIGCGPGDISRELAEMSEVESVTGLDPSPFMINRAQEKYRDDSSVNFVVGDARELSYPDNKFDSAIFHTCLCHVPGPDKALSEAYRILKPGGCLAVFDGDYATTTVSIVDDDPLQNVVDSAIANIVHDRWLVRSLERRLSTLGCTDIRRDAHPYLSKGQHSYFLTLVDRGVNFLIASGGCDEKFGDDLKAEARRRVDTGEFFGFISFVSVLGVK